MINTKRASKIRDLTFSLVKASVLVRHTQFMYYTVLLVVILYNIVCLKTNISGGDQPFFPEEESETRDENRVREYS